MKKEIENAIRQHLIITNEPGVKYAVDTIYKLMEREMSYAGILTGKDAERFIHAAENPVMADPEVVARMKKNFNSIMLKSSIDVQQVVNKNFNDLL